MRQRLKFLIIVYFVLLSSVKGFALFDKEMQKYNSVKVQEMKLFRNYTFADRSEIFLSKQSSENLTYRDGFNLLKVKKLQDGFLFEFNKKNKEVFFHLFFKVSTKSNLIEKSVFSVPMGKYFLSAMNLNNENKCKARNKDLIFDIVNKDMINSFQTHSLQSLFDTKSCSNIPESSMQKFLEILNEQLNLEQNQLIQCFNKPSNLDKLQSGNSFLRSTIHNSLSSIVSLFNSVTDSTKQNIKFYCLNDSSEPLSSYEFKDNTYKIHYNFSTIDKGDFEKEVSKLSHELLHIDTYLLKTSKNCLDENFINISNEICSKTSSSNFIIPSSEEIYYRCQLDSKFRPDFALEKDDRGDTSKTLAELINAQANRDAAVLADLQKTSAPQTASLFQTPSSDQLNSLAVAPLVNPSGAAIQPGQTQTVVLSSEASQSLNAARLSFANVAKVMDRTLIATLRASEQPANASGTQANRAAALAQGKINLANAFAATGFISEKTASEMKSMALGQGGLASSSSESSGSLNTAALQAQDSSANGLKVKASNQKSAVASGDTGIAPASAKKIATTGARVSTESNKEILSASSGEAGQMVAQNQSGLNNIKAVAKSTDTVGQSTTVNKRGVASIDSSGNQARVASTEITSGVSGGLAKNDNRVLQTLSAYKRLSGSQYKAIQELYDKQDFDKLLKSRRISIQVKQNAKNEIVIGAQSKAILSFVDDGKSLTRVDGSNAKVDGK